MELIPAMSSGDMLRLLPNLLFRAAYTIKAILHFNGSRMLVRTPSVHN